MIDARSSLEFLNGGGEMGSRMRLFDWTLTPLGPPEGWPQSLKTIVRVMLDSRFAMWMAWGPESTFFCNDAYLPTVGIKRHWVLGARADQVWEEIWHDIGPRIAHVLNTGEATWDEGLQLFLRRSGYDEETFHTFSYSPVYDDANRVAGMLCVVAEDTQRLIGERRLHLLRSLAAVSTGNRASLPEAGRELLNVLASSNHDVPFAALYLTDTRSDNSNESRGARFVASTRTPEHRPFPTGVALGSDAPAGALEEALRSQQEKLIDRFDEHVTTLQGPWPEPVKQAVVVPLAASGGTPVLGMLVLGVSTRRRLDEHYRGFLSLVADQFASHLTDIRARLEERRRIDALAELDRAKNLFFSNVSHELRTPLTLMLGPIEGLLARRDLPDDAADSLALVQRSGTRLRKLVNSLLDFSRIEAGRAEGRFEPIDLCTLTRDLAAVFRAAVEQAGLRFTVHCDSIAEPVFVDREMWEKVVLNLLSNAFKFTFEGEIRVELTVEQGQATLRVRDTGVGMAEEDLARVFDRFHRVVGARSRSQEGTGIGLALVKELIKLHHGTVEAQSVPGQGSCFTVRVPLGRGHLPQAQIAKALPALFDLDRRAYVDDALRAGNVEHTGNHETTLDDERDHVLVVDDNADMRSYLKRVLEPYWRVSIAANGRQALEMCLRNPPDLVLTDMMMSGLDGRELIQQLRSHQATRTVPVIVLSAQAGDEARVAGLHQGADDYMVKPFAVPELLARIEVQLVRSRMQAMEQGLNRRLADLFRNAPLSVATLRGEQHTIEFSNARFREFTGGRDPMGLPVRTAVPAFDKPGVFEKLDEVQAQRELQTGHSVALTLDGVPRYFEFVYQPLPRDGEEAAGIAILALEVTDLMTARKTAEAASRAKDEFIAVLGHELRNPLAPVVTALELLKLRSPESNGRELRLIERQVQHLSGLVDDLLDVARITRGSLTLDKKVIELGAIVRQAIETVSPLLENKQQGLAVRLPARGLPVLADANRMRQAVTNLLVNATRFTEPGGSITVAAEAEGHEAVLTVTDTGVGMTAEELARVFDLFAQGTQSIQRPTGGLGLGLSIARHLATLHGARLSAESAGLGRGSCFTLRIPLASVPAAVGTPAAAPARRAPAPASHRRVLVVDDSVDPASSLGELLRILGYEVRVANDGPAALELVAGEHFDAAVLDIGLPVMDGYELAQRIRSDPGHSDIRLIALTGYGQEDDKKKARASGFAVHLVKPVDVDALLQLLAA